MVSKKEQIRLASEQSGLPMTILEKSYDALSDAWFDIVVTGNSCKIGKIGTLGVTVQNARKERQGRNPLTGEAVTIPAKEEFNKPKMKFSANLKKELKEATEGKAYR